MGQKQHNNDGPRTKEHGDSQKLVGIIVVIYLPYFVSNEF